MVTYVVNKSLKAKFNDNFGDGNSKNIEFFKKCPPPFFSGGSGYVVANGEKSYSQQDRQIGRQSNNLKEKIKKNIRHLPSSPSLRLCCVR